MNFDIEMKCSKWCGK